MEVEARKRDQKRAGHMIEKGVDISSTLIDQIPAEIVTRLSAILGSEASTRDLFSAAVSGFLPEVVSTLLQIGIRQSPSGRQRPRKFDSVAWKGLEAAETITGLPKVLLLRACLSLLAKRDIKRIDLQATLDEINELSQRD